MARKRYTAEEIVATLRQVDVLMARGRQVADAVRTTGVTEVTHYRWRNESGGLKSDQVKRLKELETENARLRRAASDLTLARLILAEAAKGNFQAPPSAARASIMQGPSLASPRDGHVAYWGGIDRRSARSRRHQMMRPL